MKQLNTLILAVSLFISANAFSGTQALLVGVGQYENPQFNLEGPKYDVLALEEVLTRKWGFSKDNITKLIDGDATHANIVKELKRLKTKTKAGDQVYIYFSGHGTSRFDRDMNMPLPYSSGAFIPSDFPILSGTPKEMYAKLLIGRRDLRPILTELDNMGRSILVVFDSCYSGNAVRGLFGGADELPGRYMAMPTRDMANYGLDDDEELEFKAKSIEEAYPYNNVYFISASSDAEKAADIPARLLKKYPTFDGKPHGAFTNAILGVLNGKVKSDFNGDGEVVYNEFSRAVRDKLKSQNLKQQPQSLPQMKDDMALLAMKNVLGIKRSMDASVLPLEESSGVRVLLESGDVILLDRISKIKQIQLVRERPDLIIRQEGQDYLLLSGTYDLISRVTQPSIKALVGRVRQELWKKDIHSTLTTHASFNMELSMSESAKGVVAKEGELISFTLRSEKDIYLLLLDVDSNGQLSVLYPYSRAELAPIPANRVVFIPGQSPYQMIKVQAPFGTDHLIAIGFTQLPEFLRELIGTEVLLEGAVKREQLNALLKSKRYTYGFSEFDLITLAK